jgi:hypothetical protein
MKRIVLQVGQRFGRWLVVGDSVSVRSQTHYPCRCDCGIERNVRGTYLIRGNSQSCGCLALDRMLEASTTHGESKRTRLYVTWQGMIGRCHNPRSKPYQRYGGRGIVVCQEWRDSYVAFRDWALAHRYNDALSIDRIDNDGSYTPDNCQWANDITQANNKSNNRMVTAFGETKTIHEWARDPRCNVVYSALVTRLDRGWDAERSITTPAETRPLRRITAFGETKNLSAWARDPRCKVTRRVLERRIDAGQQPEAAMM